MYSTTEENYLKCIYVLSELSETVSTNAIAEKLENSAASVTDMIKKLAAKELIQHIPYRGIKMMPEGRSHALLLLRKHRLWECFLHNQLGFSWDELHELAEQLEHIKSVKLVDRLDEFLGFPKFDPHGEPIPDRDGKTAVEDTIALSQAPLNKALVVKSVADESDLLKHLTELKIGIGTIITIDKRTDYDDSLTLITQDNMAKHISQKAAKRIFINLQKHV